MTHGAPKGLGEGASAQLRRERVHRTPSLAREVWALCSSDNPVHALELSGQRSYREEDKGCREGDTARVAVTYLEQTGSERREFVSKAVGEGKRAN